jgi:hypothetical protein
MLRELVQANEDWTNSDCDTNVKPHETAYPGSTSEYLDKVEDIVFEATMYLREVDGP